MTTAPGADLVDVAVVGDDRGQLDQSGEVADAGLHLPLLLLGRVVVAVLLEVAHFAGDLDLAGDLDAPDGRQLG